MLEAPPDGVDRRTAAEKRYDETQAKREAEASKKAALKSHRERVNEFNAYLQNLSEHHDIPRCPRLTRRSCASTRGTVQEKGGVIPLLACVCT